MSYEVEVDGKKIVYGALTQNSRFTFKEWKAIYHEIVRQNNPELYEDRKEDNLFISVLGGGIDIMERYEALLEMLPQSSYSKAGTHPQWVSDAVEHNIYHRIITQDDVKDAIEGTDSYEELKEFLVDYFELTED